MSLDLNQIIFLYSELYFTEVVKCILAIENYCGKDFDREYMNYLKNYNKAINYIYDNELDKEKTVTLLNNNKITFVNSTYKKIFETFISGLKHEMSVNLDLYDRVREKLNPYKKNDEFDNNYLYEIRKIEEEIYQTGGLS